MGKWTLRLLPIFCGLACATCLTIAAKHLRADQGAAAPVEDARLPLPDPAARQATEKTVEDVFGHDIAAAKTAAERSALAQKIWDFARDEKDPAQRYVLLNRVRTTACAAGDAKLAMAAAAELVSGYRIDGLRAEVATLQAIEKTALTPIQAAQLAAAVSVVSDEAASHGDMDGVTELDRVAEIAVGKSGNPELQKQFAAHHKQLQEIKRQADRIKPFRAKLAEDSSDAEANLELGKYHCFVGHDWKTGLPMLAKGSDQGLKTAAQADAIEPAEATGQLQVADLWWDLSEQEKEGSYAKEALRQRAVFWYQKALPDLKGLAHLRAEKRVNDSAGKIASAGPSDTSPATATVPRSPPGSAAAQRMLLDFASTEIKAKKTKQSKEPGFTLGNQQFSLVPDNGGILVGLDVSVAERTGKITGVRPLFITSKGQIPGPVVGQSDPKGVRLMAKKGYAIGAITVKGGLGIDGLIVTFMRMEDDALDTKQSYDSPALGNPKGGTLVGGDGDPVVGIFGHYDRRNVAALGVVQVGKGQAPAQ